MERPTLQDVARKAGVSPSTVSRVIRNESNVSESAASNVRAAMRALNYDSHKLKYRKLIGLVVPDITNPFFSIMLQGVETVARVNGYSVVIHDSHDMLSQEDESIERLLSLPVDGVIVTPSSETSALLSRLIGEGFPIVLADRLLQQNETVCSVSVDNSEGAYQGAKYLVSLGHKAILHIGGPSHASTERRRFAGFCRALAEAGIERTKGLALSGNYHFEESYELVADAIRKKLGFTSIFSSNDIMALGAIKAIQDANLRVPQDISVCGYDDIPFSTLVGLTTISQPAYEMGRNAMIILNDLIERKIEPPSQIVLKPSLVIRNTCRAAVR